jgi:hypothetical protein
MDGWDIAALLVLLLMGGLLASAIYGLASWPGRVAHKRQHPYSTAISIGGWVTLFAGGVFWPLILVWAYATPETEPVEVVEDKATQEVTA